MPVVDTIFIGFLLRVPVNELQHQAGDRIVGRDGAEHDRVMVPLVHFEKFRLASLPDQSFLELFGQVGQGRQILFRCKQQEWRQPGPDVANRGGRQADCRVFTECGAESIDANGRSGIEEIGDQFQSVS